MTYRQFWLVESRRIGHGTTHLLDGSTPNRLCLGYFWNGSEVPGFGLSALGFGLEEPEIGYLGQAARLSSPTRSRRALRSGRTGEPPVPREFKNYQLAFIPNWNWRGS